MIHGVGWRENIRVVTVLANVSRLNVRGALADGFDTVMTARAIINNTQVVEISRSPRDG